MTHRPELDDQTADRLLSGGMAPDDAPPGYAAVAALLGSARPAPSTGSPADVDALVEAIRTDTGPADPRRKPVLARLLTVKAAALVGALVLGAGTAAAATGSLPGPAQDTAHDVLAKVGVGVPKDDAPKHRDDGAPGQEGEDASTTTSTTPKAANAGICNAKDESAGHPDEHSRVAQTTDEQCADVAKPGHDEETTTTTTGSEPGDDHGPSADHRSPSAGSPADDHPSGEDHPGTTPTTPTTAPRTHGGSQGEDHGGSGQGADHGGSGQGASHSGRD
jgi:hypothetical protein